MKIIDVPFAVLRFQYRIARYPLQLIEDRLAIRMDSESPARLLYERSFGALDATVGSLLSDSQLSKRGSALAERSDTLSRAARLDAAAARKKTHAEQALSAKHDKAVEDLEAARDAKVRDQARTEADQRKRAAAEAAHQRSAAAKGQADDLAARRTEAAEQAKRQERARISATQEKASAAAKSKLDDAQAKRNEAAGKRAQADRVEQLADLEKQKRQAARASKP